ncbi:TPA: response regulator transcription factor [Streptococcus pneumoniae]|uniref:response regulator transcription factor n=1 Tax=Streptococcus pneumoniae TaxID=1313 RepID=UPI000B58E797|nr:response regulator transcription factor [Streptococcus pneumoniae]SNF49198.1 response regulator [Streptococcus pneumoniae]HET5078370.1 response regulator transcription factor [Streptococcus pneumoniae]HET8320569.1 response regulator transcription factor [Streptococcus pneumoniae]HEU9120251.1 response regulator transcription factor [Streptococcus pneumoniae]HEU9317839.1 response regulator transcription factor [Streptococcus pneumoniae]
MGKTILLVDDEVEITDIHQRYLIQAGYQVLVAHDGLEALELCKKKPIDLIITDVMMPRMDGYDLISEVQYLSPEQPFLFITAKTSEQDKIYGLSLGADDFIAKPFSPRELVLRVHNILRRLHRGGETELISLGNLKMNHSSHEVQIGEEMLDLTVKSFELLWILASNPERVFSKTDLYEKIWKEDYVDDTNTLNVHIHALRQELAKYSSDQTPTIKTVWGLGYKIEKPRGQT